MCVCVCAVFVLFIFFARGGERNLSFPSTYRLHVKKKSVFYVVVVSAPWGLGLGGWVGRAPFIGTLLLGRAIKLKIKIKVLITNKNNERASRREVGKMDMVIIMRVPCGSGCRVVVPQVYVSFNYCLVVCICTCAQSRSWKQEF